jgi:hypothetical protein
VKRWLLAVMLLCGACEPIEGDTFDAGAMDAGEVLVDGSADDGGDLIDKQFGGSGPTNWPTDADYALFPLSVMIGPKVPAGWQSTSSLWLYAIWPRTGTIGGGGQPGVWYRGGSGAVNGAMTLTVQPWSSGSYTCHVGFLGAECFHVDGRRASLACPPTVTMEMREWRSSYNAYAPQVGYFFWHLPTHVKWASFPDRIVAPMRSVVITGSGKQINCSYVLPVDVDLWIEQRRVH